MNAGLLRRSAREAAPATAIFAAGLAVVEMLLAIAARSAERLVAGPLLDLPFVQGIFQALLGVQPSDQGGLAGAFASVAWAHPVVLALVWAHAITLFTRVPAGEADRGTLDLFLGLPVGRWQLWWHEGLVGGAAAALVTMAAMVGALAGAAAGGVRLPGSTLALLAVNLACLAALMAGFAALASAVSAHQAPARGAAVGLAVGAVLLHYLGQFWAAAGRFVFLSPIHYYRPLPIIQQGRVQPGDLITLAAAALALWIAGGLVFTRRDLLSG